MKKSTKYLMRNVGVGVAALYLSEKTKGKENDKFLNAMSIANKVIGVTAIVRGVIVAPIMAALEEG